MPALAPLLPTLLLGASAQAAPPEEQVVWVTVSDAADLALVRELGLGWDEGRRGERYRLRAPLDRLDDLERSGLSWSPAPPAPAPEGYRDNADHLAALEGLAEAAPEVATLVDLGESTEGRRLAGLRITATASPRTRVRVLGAHHGDEPISAELALGLAEELVSGWLEAEPGVTELLEEHEVFVQPVVNPDGLAADTRANARGVDLNRNYDFEWSSASYQPGEAPFSEAETRAVRTQAAWTAYGSGLSLHSGALNLGWVWNHTLDRTEEDALLEELALAYAAVCEASGFYVTNGADWYVTHGDTTDWAYGRHGTLDYTLELSSEKAPPLAELSAWQEVHSPGMRAFLAWPHTVALRVVDAESGQGVPATVTLLEGGWPGTSAPDGSWGRPVEAAGSYTVEVAAPGHETAVVDLSTEEPAPTLALAGADLATWLPTERLLSRGGPGELQLPEGIGALTLSRPGEDPVVAGELGEGAWRVDLDRLSPGPWTLETDQGVIPRGVFVGELDDGAVIDGVSLAGGDALGEDEGSEGRRLTVSGTGFGRGSRAFALWGAARPPVELEVLAESEEEVLLDAALLPEDDQPVDLLLLTRGYQLAVLDLGGAEQVDTGAPLDTGTVDSGTPGRDSGQQDSPAPSAGGGGGGGSGGCGCASAGRPGYPALLAALCLAGLLTRRRRP